jgi:peptidyl-prolyl cis-trans isomerase A (cyclophilin A)
MMKYFYQLLILVLIFNTSWLYAQDHNKLPEVVFETQLGQIVFEINSKQAPRTSAYFLSLVDSKLFEGTSFFRAGVLGTATKPQLIQGGPLDKHIINGTIKPFAETKLPTLANFETTIESGLKHEEGTLTLAKDLFGSGDAIPDLVICLERLPQEDYNGSSLPDNRGFPAFGRVIQGMDIVKKIASQPTTGNTQITFLQGQILTKPIKISRVYRQ